MTFVSHDIFVITKVDLKFFGEYDTSSEKNTCV